MANKPNEIIKIAKELKAKGYVYVYGYKGSKVTRNGVLSLARQYPNVFTASIKALALKKVGKMGIDCSGFVNKCAGTSLGGSSQICSSAPHKWKVSDTSHIKNGMFIWKNGHIGLIEVNSTGIYIHEAMGTAYDLRVSRWQDRASHFTMYGEIKGVNYSVTKNSSKPVSATSYVKGNIYTLNHNLNVRTSAENKGTANQMRYSKLTDNAKKHAKNVDGYGVLKSGTQVTCQNVVKKGNGTVWMKIPSGYICAKTKEKTYVK